MSHTDHVEILKNSRVTLVSMLDLTNTLLLDGLTQRGVLGTYQHEYLLAENNNLQRASKLVSLLLIKSGEQYQIFLRCLREYDHGHVADILVKRRETPDISSGKVKWKKASKMVAAGSKEKKAVAVPKKAGSGSKSKKASLIKDIESLAVGNFTKGMRKAVEYVAEQVEKGTKKKDSQTLRIVFIDTGCDKKHKQFNGWNIVCKSFTASPDDTDPDGHGTRVIGLFCSMFANTSLVSKIEVHSFKVCADTAPGRRDEGDPYQWDDDALYKAFDAIRHAQPPFHIVNMSGGYPGFPSFKSKQIELVTQIAEKTTVICAASNEGVNNTDKILFPASDTIAIGSCTDEGIVSDFTPQGRLLLFLAQGQGMQAPLSRQAAASENRRGRNLYTVHCNGTSFATPLASGIAALLTLKAGVGEFGFEAEEKETLVTTRIMKRLLRETTDYPHATERGYGPLRPQTLLQDDDLFRSKLNKVLQCTELYQFGTDV